MTPVVHIPLSLEMHSVSLALKCVSHLAAGINNNNNNNNNRRCTMPHSVTRSVKKLVPLTKRSGGISIGCLSAAEHQTVEQYSKTGRTYPENISAGATNH